MTTLIEFALELILLGTVGAATSKQTPMIIRVLLAALLLSACLGLFALILYVGIRVKSMVICATAFLVLLSTAILILPKIRRIRKR